MEKKRINVHVYTNSQCNLKCKHCYSAYNTKKGEELTIDELVDIIKALCSEYHVYFDIEGGELFLRDDIGDFLERLTEEERSKITITTNGTIYPPIKSSFLRELDEFRVSIEGHTDELHSDLRGISLEPILQNCRKWLDHQVPVVLRLTVNMKNYLYIPQIFERFTSMGFKRFSFYEFQPVGRGKLNKEYCLDDEAFHLVIGYLCDAAETYSRLDYIKLSLPGKRRLWVKEHMKLFRKFDVEDMSLIPTLTINHNGEIGVCPWNIAEKGTENIRNTDLLKETAKIMREQGRRHDCEYCSDMKLLFKIKR